MPSHSIPSQISDNVANFIRRFYALSDDESKHDEYVKSFVAAEEGLSFQIGPMQPVHQPDDILQWRHEKWAPVATRKHTVSDVYGHSTSSDRVMLHGIVEYEFKDGKTGSASWGGLMVFQDPSKEELFLKEYTVWLTVL